MGKASGIAWTHHTFNTWWGCVKVSPACDHCYAATWDARDARRRGEHAHWGKDAPRRFFDDAHWNEPRLWNRAAEKSGERTFVFCASMADIFEGGRDDVEPARWRLWETIASTPSLTWLLLTKRPQNVAQMLPLPLKGAESVWLGTTVESPEYLWRIDALVENQAPVRFVSMEPLLAATSIAAHLVGQKVNGINWVIAGCESGRDARPTPTDWYRALRDECRDNTNGSVPFFHKQARRGVDGITSDLGSSLKLAQGVIERPYLDGVQHVEWPDDGDA